VEPAAITFGFDPVIPLGDSASVSLETIGIAVALLVAILLAAWIARRMPATGPLVAPPGGHEEPAPTLRTEDVLFLAVGAVPGAVLGGRLGYVLDHLQFYRANPSLVTDFSQGSLSLTLGVPLGILSAALIARLIGAPVGRWLHAAAFPLLVGLLLGKVANVLGGTGQGLPTDLPWATAYVGPGPWGSLAPDVASHPAQAYEALLIAVAILGLVLATRLGVVSRRDGAAMFVAVALWALARFAVAFTWRDPVEIGPLRVDQVLSLLLVVLAGLGILERRRTPAMVRGRREGERDVEVVEPA
jgi:phosphatidylglycerol:prolipoprotein diacylglycerol transferase